MGTAPAHRRECRRREGRRLKNSNAASVHQYQAPNSALSQSQPPCRALHVHNELEQRAQNERQEMKVEELKLPRATLAILGFLYIYILQFSLTGESRLEPKYSK